MSDLFHTSVPDDYIAAVFAVMATAHQHTYQVLTKRHARMRSLLSSRAFGRLVAEQITERGGPADAVWPLRNVWLGVSVENQQWADIRIPDLLHTPAAVRFLSCEPLLGPIDLRRAVVPMGSQRGHGLTASFVHWGDCCDTFHGIGWVIVGGESGPGARPMHPDWARDLRDQCQAATGVRFLFKQWGAWAPTGYGIGRFTDPERLIGDPVDQMGHRQIMRRVGKHTAGRVLDGRTWDEYPATHQEGTAA